MFTGLWRDLVHAARSLAQARAFTFVCVVSLGVGMVPVFAIPYAARIPNTPPRGLNTDGLVELDTTPLGARAATDRWSYPDFLALRDADTGMTLSAWTSGDRTIALDTPAGVETRSVPTMFVSADYFRTIDVTLARGPGFDEKTDDTPEAKPVVILGYDFWRSELAADPDIVGRTLTLDRIPHRVVGIAPEGFTGHLALMGRRLFVPIEQHPKLRDRAAGPSARTDRNDQWFHVHGRLQPGVTLPQARARVAATTAELAARFPATNEFRAGTVAPYHPFGALQRFQLLAIEAVGLTLTGTVLVVVCLNISGMMQVRSAIRERELSIRQALGATRGRLVRYVLSEAAVLAALGGALASVVLFNLPSVVAWFADRPLPAEMQDALRIDTSTAAICVGVCLLTSVVFGLLPAVRFSRPAVISSLKDEAGAGGFRVGKVHRFTAALQVAIAVPLIVMAGQSLDRFRATATSDLGFQADLIYAAPLQFEPAERAATAAFKVRTARDNLAGADGVAAVTVADGLPLDFHYRMAKVSMQPNPDAAPQVVDVHVTRVGEGYMDAMGIALLRGRGFTADDREGADLVTVISKPLADKLFPGADAADAIGRRLTLGSDEDTQKPLTIVGVTGDFPTSQMSTTREQLLLPLAQHSSNSLFLIARSAPGEPAAKLTAALDNAVADLGPDFTRNVRTGDGEAYDRIVTGVWLRENSMCDFLVQSTVSATAGGVILALAALGIYGVVGLMVAARTREIAVRAALGATRWRVLRMVLIDVVTLALPGVAVGIVLTIALNRINADNMGVSLSRAEPLAYLAGAAVAVLVALVASLVPARRAAAVDPMVAMRST